MLNWFQMLDTRGRLFFAGISGIVINGILFVFGMWMPVLLFLSIGVILLAWCMKSEDSTDI